MTRRFDSPAAFRQALEQRLRTTAEARGVDLNALRLKLLIERLLARLFAGPNPPWRLKGGFAMELRLRARARTTKDLDLAFPTNVGTDETADRADAIRELLQTAAQRDLGDHLVFRVGAATRRIEAAPEGGARFPVVVSLAGREYGRFGVDVGVGPDSAQAPERLVGDDLLAFAGIEPVVALAVPREVQFAEKILAYTRPWGARINTRVKDLVDLLLLIELGLGDEAALRRALHESVSARPGRTLPPLLPESPAEWADTFAAMAEDVGLAATDRWFPIIHPQAKSPVSPQRERVVTTPPAPANLETWERTARPGTCRPAYRPSPAAATGSNPRPGPGHGTSANLTRPCRSRPSFSSSFGPRSWAASTWPSRTWRSATNRAHLSLERNAPNLRTRARTPAVEIHGTPVLGGLHHRYRAVA